MGVLEACNRNSVQITRPSVQKTFVPYSIAKLYCFCFSGCLFCRTIDSLAVAYGKGKLACFLGDLRAVVDVVSFCIKPMINSLI